MHGVLAGALLGLVYGCEISVEKIQVKDKRLPRQLLIWDGFEEAVERYISSLPESPPIYNLAPPRTIIGEPATLYLGFCELKTLDTDLTIFSPNLKP